MMSTGIMLGIMLILCESQHKNLYSSAWFQTIYICILGGTRWRRWLRHCATSRKVAGSISDLVIGFCVDLILLTAICPWGRLRLWQNLVPEIFPGGKGGRCVGLTALPPSCEDILEILGASNSCSPKGLSRTVMRQLLQSALILHKMITVRRFFNLFFV